MRCTPLLVDSNDFTYSFKTRLYWTINKIQDWNNDKVRCVICKKPMININIKKLKDGYKKTCCKPCERKLSQQQTKRHLQEKYGVTNVFQLIDVAKKLKANSNKIQKKREETKRKNHTFKTSKKEEDAYQFLCSIFPKENIIRQFKDDKRYPFCCDFYIMSKDMFIECNFSWTHGGHWFDENDLNDVAMLTYMKSKHSKYYDNAIDAWTIRDVKKKRYAKENNLNYVVFWTLDELKSYKF